MDRPKTYAKYSVLQRRDNEFTVDKYLKLVRWKRFPKILDVGCGDGATTREVLEPMLPQDYVKLVGSDIQEKMIRFVKESNKSCRLDFVQNDISGDELIAERFDHVFSFFALHWVTKLRKAFKNIFDLLTPGGDMLISVVTEVPYHDLMKRQLEHPIWGQYLSTDMIPAFHSIINPEKVLRTHLIESGFTNIKIYSEEREFAYENWVHCLKSLLALDPIISKLDNEQKEEFIVDFFFTLRDTFIDCEEPNGEIRMPYKLLVVYASKPE